MKCECRHALFSAFSLCRRWWWHFHTPLKTWCRRLRRCFRHCFFILSLSMSSFSRRELFHIFIYCHYCHYISEYYFRYAVLFLKIAFHYFSPLRHAIMIAFITRLLTPLMPESFSEYFSSFSSLPPVILYSRRYFHHWHYQSSHSLLFSFSCFHYASRRCRVTLFFSLLRDIRMFSLPLSHFWYIFEYGSFLFIYSFHNAFHIYLGIEFHTSFI